MEQQTLQGNNTIRLFIGDEFVMQRLVAEKEWNKNRDLLYNEDIKFHSSWDWLMPVVEKIKNYILTDRPYDVGIDKVDVLNLYITTPILTVFEQVIYFIQWYNNQKATHGTTNTP